MPLQLCVFRIHRGRDSDREGDRHETQHMGHEGPTMLALGLGLSTRNMHMVHAEMDHACVYVGTSIGARVFAPSCLASHAKSPNWCLQTMSGFRDMPDAKAP